MRFYRNCKEYEDNFRNYGCLNNVKFSVCEQGMSFNLLRSLISLSYILYSSVYKSYTSLTKFISKYCILEDAVVKRIFLPSFYIEMQLSFYRLIVYPTASLNSLISSNRFFFNVHYTGFSMHMAISSVNRNSFPASFPTWMPLITFSFLIALSRTSSVILNRSGNVNVLILFLTLEEKLAPLMIVH